MSAASRHIIERPRLTRRLDEATAKVITLVAPAGYGKTTLARQWLADRPHAWFRANEASSDVVALAVEIAKTLAPLVGDASAQIHTRARTMRDFDGELHSLAELQANTVRPCPADAWLLIDDYENLARSPVAQKYVRLLVESLDVRFLIGSRVNPVWATPRALLYGEITRIDRLDLAMREAETHTVLAGAPNSRISEIVDLADGWPALVGLASLTDLDEQPAGELPRPIFDYLADELFRRCSRPLQVALPQLALPPRMTTEVAGFLLGPKRGPRLLDEATEIGFFSPAGSDRQLHPLLRRFLQTKLESQHAVREAASDKLISFFMDRKEWDDAFELISRQGRAENLVRLCDACYASMLCSGRTTTLNGWLSLAAELGSTSPLFDLIRAELALRNGNPSRAERLSLRIVAEEGTDPYRSRAFNVAGRSAHQNDRDSDALDYFQSAAETARSADEQHEANWGSVLSAQAMETREEVLATLEQFLAREPSSPDDVLRAANARLMVGLTVGDLTDALELAHDALDALRHAHDPVVRTSFLNNLSRSLSLQARYAQGRSFADMLIADARQATLDFVLPHGYLARAIALVGLGKLVEAESTAKRAERFAEAMNDRHNTVDTRNVRAKLAITVRDYERALALTSDPGEALGVTTAMTAELLATRGLAQACAGQSADARASLVRSESLSSLPEVRSLAACARAVVTLREVGDTDEALVELQPALDLTIFDPIVVTCRACPEFGGAVQKHHLLPIVVLRQVRPLPKQTHETLTTREQEVLKLLSLGYTNREIASELFIAEVTAKVHVRNVIRKLGVRSRTEAAIRALQSFAP